MVSTGAALIVLASIGGLLGFFALGGPSMFMEQDSGGLTVVNPGSNVPPINTNPLGSTKTNLGAGDRVTIDSTHFDTLSRAALAETTNAVTTVLRAKTGAQFGVQPTDNNPYYTIAATGDVQTIQLVDADEGMITLAYDPAAGQAFRLDIEEFVLANPGVVERYAYYDWDDDGDKQFVIQLNTKFLKPIEVTETTPTLNVQTPWANENTITLSAPADQASLGTATTTATVYWEGTGTSNDVTFWRHIIIRVNQTGIDEYDLGASYLLLDGQRYNLADADQYGAVGSNYEWKFILGENIGTAPYHEFTVSQGTKVYLTSVFKLTMDASDELNTTLEVSSWDAAGTPNAAVSDSVELAA